MPDMSRRCTGAARHGAARRGTTRERLGHFLLRFPPSPGARIIFTRLASSSRLCSFVAVEAARPSPSYRGRYAARLGKHIVARAVGATRAPITHSHVGRPHPRHRATVATGRFTADSPLHSMRYGSTRRDSLARTLARILHARESGCCGRAFAALPVGPRRVRG